jgi:hypothetical protein
VQAIHVEVKNRDALYALDALARRQIPFATAVALTRTAIEARDAVRMQAKERFTIRTPWVLKGIQAKSADKRSLTAHVIARDDFMALQEEGGVKEARGKALGVPVEARNPKTLVTRPSKWPGALLRRKRKFFTGQVKGNVPAVFRRDEDGGLTLFYTLRPRVSIKPRFGMVEKVREVVTSRYAALFAEAFAQARKTAKPR